MNRIGTARVKTTRMRAKPSRAMPARTPHREALAVRPPQPRNNAQPVIGLLAEYRREDYVFAREQSYAMQRLEWEERVPPIRCWGLNAVADLAWRCFG
jgi:hypothetical protein